MEREEFRNLVYSAYEKAGRTFPWRDNTGAWGILVSEFMLQQTQTERVVPYWERWMEKWPSPSALSGATLEEVLKEWSGLGYNRRGKHLRECAGIIVRECGGKVPAVPAALERLPGIGPYTAGAIACFAYNYPAVFIETNIRSVMLSFFFPGREGIADKEIMPLIEETLDRSNPRKWYWALMDCGAALKRDANPGRRGANYRRQSAFKGSFRQVRGGLIRALVARGPATAEELRSRMDIPADEENFYKALDVLRKEAFIVKEGGMYRIGEKS